MKRTRSELAIDRVQWGIQQHLKPHHSLKLKRAGGRVSLT